MNTTRYYYSTTGQNVLGPVTEAQLFYMLGRGEIPPNTQICVEGEVEWQSLRSPHYSSPQSRELTAAKIVLVSIGVIVLLFGSIFGLSNSGKHRERGPTADTAKLLRDPVIVSADMWKKSGNLTGGLVSIKGKIYNPNDKVIRQVRVQWNQVPYRWDLRIEALPPQTTIDFETNSEYCSLYPSSMPEHSSPIWGK